MLRERTEFNGRHFEATWECGEVLPPRDLITQVSAVCFAPDGLVVMISSDGVQWHIPGGHPELGETLEMALAREIREEACCEVIETRLLGWQHMRDMGDGSEHFQMRYYCRIQVDAFSPEHEITHRKLVAPAAFLQTLAYGHSPIARELFALAVKVHDEVLY